MKWFDAARLSVVTLCFGTLLAQGDLAGRSPAMATVLAGRPDHGLPGAVAGTERWIVHFQKRGFDLSGFKNAVDARRPAAEVAAIVAGLELLVQADQAQFVKAVQGLGGRVTRQWWLVNAAAIEIAPAQLDALRRLPNVRFVQPDEACEAVIQTATNPTNHNADDLQALGHVGLGVAVGVVDTGQDESMNAGPRPHRTYFPGGNPSNTTGGGIGGSRLLVNRQIGLLGADDPHGHGTGVASICAGANWGIAIADDGHAPMAGICGYSLSNSSGGNSDLQTIATAWQTLATDRVAYNIVSANMSYTASPDPLDVSQQAIDAAALNADVVCCVAAANSGQSTAVSCGAANAIAVGAVDPNSHTVAGFSSRGPLQGDPGRFYPDIAACGVGTVMAGMDNEAGNYTASGTSMASPQVAGASAQLRARFPFLTAVETKAVLLASCLDLATQNPGLTRNDYGMGLLRNDRAHQLVAAGSVGSGTVAAGTPVQFASFPVVLGRSYQASIAWHRLDTTSTAWSDLNLEVLTPGGAVIGSSTTPRNLYEVVRFNANFTGTVTLRVTATSVGGGPVQPFAWAGIEAPPVPVVGTAAAFGAGCSPICSTLNDAGGTLAPLTQASEVAYDMVAASAQRIVAIDIFSSSNLSGASSAVVTIYGNTGGVINTTRTGITSVSLGTAPGFYRATFANPPTVPAGPFWIGIDHRNLATNLSNLTTGTAVGSYQRPTLMLGAWTRSPFTVRPGFRVYCQNPIGVGAPRLTVVGTPRIGATVQLNLSAALPNSAAFLAMGLSDTTSSSGPLPFSLAPLGAPGCFVLTSSESLQLRVVDGLGATSGGLTVPNDPSFVSMRLYAQYLVVHPTANSLGMLTSAGSNLFLGN